MNEKELGKALLRLDANQLHSGADIRKLTARILQRDRRRLWVLASLTVLLWLMATAVVVVIIYLYFDAMVPHQRAMMREAEASGRKVEIITAAHTMATTIGTAIVAGAVGLLALAALCTLLLVFASRRATLRQINANLLVISEQLRELQQALQAAERS
jgi:hypothetical protein